MSDIIDINVAQTVEEITINATPNLIEVNINNMNAAKHSDLILDDGTNPHGTTKADVGLSNVPNLDTTNAVNLAHTHNNFTALNALSGTNTGDETTLSIQTKRPLKTINSTSLEGNGNIEINVDFSTHDLEELQNVTSTNYTTPIDTDSLLTYDVTNALWKRLSWSNIKSNLKTYFDGIYTTTSAVATQITTALSEYATQTFVTSQGYITNVITALGFTPENVANKSTLTTLGTSDTLYPTQNAVKVYADTKVDKVSTTDVEKVYIKNADGTQGMKATTDLQQLSLIHKNTVSGISVINNPNFTEKYAYGILIPANTFKIGDFIDIEASFEKVSGGNAELYPKFAINSIDSLSGATILSNSFFPNTQIYAKIQRSLVIKSATNTEILHHGTYSNISWTSAATSGNKNIDWTTNKYLIAIISNNGSTDATWRLSSIIITKK